MSAAGLPRRDVLRGGGALAVAGALAAVGLSDAPMATASAPLLRQGSRGGAVARVQRRLSALDYWAGPVDGVFGMLTLQGVLAMQKVAGIVRDGVVGPVTRSHLDAGTRPAARTRRGDALEVDIARQVLLVVSAGTVQAIHATSTGSETPYYHRGRWWPARTTTGSYRVYRVHRTGWEHGPLGSLYRPMYFNGGIALHGAESVPASPASHGCCRVTPAAMDQLWHHAGLGTRVRVH